MTYTRNAKQVLRNGRHFADCIDDEAAQLIIDALNAPDDADQGTLPLQGAQDGPLFMQWGARHSIRQENDEYACACGMRWDVTDGDDHP
jgi:hypothetical protein